MFQYLQKMQRKHSKKKLQIQILHEEWLCSKAACLSLNKL